MEGVFEFSVLKVEGGGSFSFVKPTIFELPSIFDLRNRRTKNPSCDDPLARNRSEKQELFLYLFSYISCKFALQIIVFS